METKCVEGNDKIQIDLHRKQSLNFYQYITSTIVRLQPFRLFGIVIFLQIIELRSSRIGNVCGMRSDVFVQSDCTVWVTALYDLVSVTIYKT